MTSVNKPSVNMMSGQVKQLDQGSEQCVYQTKDKRQPKDRNEIASQVDTRQDHDRQI